MGHYFHAAENKNRSYKHISMILLYHRCIRRGIAGLFLVIFGLVPLKAVFACAMIGQTLEHCCCQHSCKADCESSRTRVGKCCHMISLPQSYAEGVPVSDRVLGFLFLDLGKLPLVLPPREVGPDPPALADAAQSPYLSRPPAWLQGADIYLLTLRLRN
jgi:hypothetical protein